MRAALPILLALAPLLLALPPAAPTAQAHEVACTGLQPTCAASCLVHIPGGLNHSCTVNGVEVFQTWSCFPEGFHVEVGGVVVRRCGPPSLP